MGKRFTGRLYGLIPLTIGCLIIQGIFAFGQEDESYGWFAQYKQRRRESSLFMKTRVCDVFHDIGCSVLWLNLNMISWDTFKIAVGIFPFFVGARMIDDCIHSCFYKRSHHKNIHQIPHWAKEWARVATGPLIGILGIQAFFARDKEFRITNQVMLLGLPFVLFANQIIKKFEFESCWRPWNGDFDRHKRASGGFPSGHTAQIAYLATLYGLRYGPKAAIPLSILAASVGGVFVATNRHYFSQIIAGVGLGMMYGFAGDKLISSKMASCLSIDVTMDEQARPGLGISYTF